MNKNASSQKRLSPAAKQIAELVKVKTSGSQIKFAKLVGCSQSMVSKILNGQIEPGEDLLAKIAKSFDGVELSELIAIRQGKFKREMIESFLVPVATGLLHKPPHQCQNQLTANELCVSPAIYRPSVYAVAGRVCLPVIDDPDERILPDDYLLMDGSPENIEGNVSSLNGKLAAIYNRNNSQTGSIVTLQRIQVRMNSDTGEWVVSASQNSSEMREAKSTRTKNRTRALMFRTQTDETVNTDARIEMSSDLVVGVAIGLFRNL